MKSCWEKSTVVIEIQSRLHSVAFKRGIIKSELSKGGILHSARELNQLLDYKSMCQPPYSLLPLALLFPPQHQQQAVVRHPPTPPLIVALPPPHHTA